MEIVGIREALKLPWGKKEEEGLGDGVEWCHFGG